MCETIANCCSIPYFNVVGLIACAFAKSIEMKTEQFRCVRTVASARKLNINLGHCPVEYVRIAHIRFFFFPITGKNKNSN